MAENALTHCKENALAALHSGNLVEARQALDQGLAIDFEDALIVAMLKGVRYWEDRLSRLGSAKNDLERSDQIMEYWDGFVVFVQRHGLQDEKTLYAFRTLAFKQIQQCLMSYNTSEGGQNPEVLWRMGLCHKLFGNFDAARKFLEAAWHLNKEHPIILAELADIHALLDQTDIAKLLFREAFFIDPAAIPLNTLESALICRIIDHVRSQNIAPAEICYWIPIFAILGGVFTSNREIKALEYGKLKQSIYSLEREFQENAQRRSSLIPQLLNRYFWMLDYAKETAQPRHVMAEILLKIESLHPGVYKLYTS